MNFIFEGKLYRNTLLLTLLWSIANCMEPLIYAITYSFKRKSEILCQWKISNKQYLNNLIFKMKDYALYALDFKILSQEQI